MPRTPNQEEAAGGMQNRVVSKKLRQLAYQKVEKVKPELRADARNWVGQPNRKVSELAAFIAKMEKQ